MIPEEVAEIANIILRFFSEPQYYEDDWEIAVDCAWTIYKRNKD